MATSRKIHNELEDMRRHLNCLENLQCKLESVFMDKLANEIRLEIVGLRHCMENIRKELPWSDLDR